MGKELLDGHARGDEDGGQGHDSKERKDNTATAFDEVCKGTKMTD